jgi:Cu+-exporting ATPase
LAGSGANIIRVSFIISLVYNVIGLSFAMQGLLQPIYAAILMPCSTLSIVLVTSGMANISALRKKLSVVSDGE